MRMFLLLRDIRDTPMGVRWEIGHRGIDRYLGERGVSHVERDAGCLSWDWREGELRGSTHFHNVLHPEMEIKWLGHRSTREPENRATKQNF